MNRAAQALGRLAKGVPKRISNKERLRRRRAMEKINRAKRLSARCSAVEKAAQAVGVEMNNDGLRYPAWLVRESAGLGFDKGVRFIRNSK